MTGLRSQAAMVEFRQPGPVQTADRLNLHPKGFAGIFGGGIWTCDLQDCEAIDGKISFWILPSHSNRS
jgi:hypothetical protein